MKALLFKASVWLAIIACCAAALAAAGEDVRLTDEEWQVATLVKLLPYVAWPEKNQPDLEAKLVVGVLGPDPITRSLEELAKETKVRGQSLRVITVDPKAVPENLQVLFVPQARAAAWLEFSKKFDRSGVLTAGAVENFTWTGGVLGFRLGDRKLVANLKNARKAGLTIDSKLLRLCILDR